MPLGINNRMSSVGGQVRFYRVPLSIHHDGQRDVCLHCASTDSRIPAIGEIGDVTKTIQSNKTCTPVR